jgi:hypothetical protein
MVKKHLPVTKLVARNANKVHVPFSCRSSLGYLGVYLAAGDSGVARPRADNALACRASMRPL